LQPEAKLGGADLAVASVDVATELVVDVPEGDGGVTAVAFGELSDETHGCFAIGGAMGAIVLAGAVGKTIAGAADRHAFGMKT
jgi:hypothetical protein